MKKIVFTLGAVTTVCACGLFIDPDKLVEGNGAGTDPTIDGGEDATTADTGGGDAAPDAKPLEVPECVPEKPAGTEGPYAVASAAAPATAVCPPGYLATPVTSASGDGAAEAIVCGSAAGCTCVAGGAAACGMRVKYYSDLACTKLVVGQPTIIANGCADLDSQNFFKIERAIGGISCGSSGDGTTAPTVKPAPAYASGHVICAPDPGVQTAQCKSGQIALPAAKNARACVVGAIAVPCAAPYSVTRDLSKSGTFNDNRTCNCACAVNAAACTGGTVTMYSNGTCESDPTAEPLDTCRPVGKHDSATGTQPTLTGNACSATATASGSVSPQLDLRLCCLP